MGRIDGSSRDRPGRHAWQGVLAAPPERQGNRIWRFLFGTTAPRAPPSRPIEVGFIRLRSLFGWRSRVDPTSRGGGGQPLARPAWGVGVPCDVRHSWGFFSGKPPPPAPIPSSPPPPPPPPPPSPPSP